MSIDLMAVISVSLVLFAEESLIRNAEQAILSMITVAALKGYKSARTTRSQIETSKPSLILTKQSFQDSVASSKWTEHIMAPTEALKSLLKMQRTNITLCCLTMIIRTPLFQSTIV